MSEPRPSRQPYFCALAFVPCLTLLIFVAFMRDPWRSGDSSTTLRDELFGFGVIAGFIALLWIASQEVSRPRATAVLKRRGFDVMPARLDVPHKPSGL